MAAMSSAESKRIGYAALTFGRVYLIYAVADLRHHDAIVECDCFHIVVCMILGFQN